MKSDREADTTSSRKPYVTPRLIKYGNLRELTQTKGGTASDGTGKVATRLTAKPG